MISILIKRYEHVRLPFEDGGRKCSYVATSQKHRELSATDQKPGKGKDAPYSGSQREHSPTDTLTSGL